MIDELLIRVTYRCDKNCDFCFNKVFEDKVHYESNECLDIEKIKKIIKDNGIKIIYISGGEPTVYDKIEQFTTEISKMGKTIYFTNGLLFKKFSDGQINNMGIEAINISIYTDEIVKDLGNFDKKYIRLLNFKKKYPNIKLNAQVMIDNLFFNVVESENFKKMSELFDRINWQPLSVPKDHYMYKNTLEGMKSEEVDKICDYLSSSGMEKKVDSFKRILKGDINDKCLMGIKYITINPDMTISICPHVNDNTISIEQFDKIKGKIIDSNNNCLSMRCVSLQSFLNKKYNISNN